MHVNPLVHMATYESCLKLKKNREIRIQKNLYTGCTSSVIIKKENANKILKLLKNYMSTCGPKIPLDNYLYRLMYEKKLKVCGTLPFVTSIRLELIQRSTIQESNKKLSGVRLSQKFCSLLRRDLSYIDNPKDTKTQLIECIDKLEKLKNPPGKEDDFGLINELAKYTVNNELLLYEFDGRLKNEPMNAQNN